MPIEIKYRFKKHFYVDDGIQAGLMHEAFDEFNNTVIDDDDLVYTLKIKDQISRLDAGVSGGFGYKLIKGISMNFGAGIIMAWLTFIKIPGKDIIHLNVKYV